MAKKREKQKVGRKVLQRGGVAFSKINYQLFAAAMLVLIIGYWALAQPPVDGFLTLTVAPILLVIGYLVLIPLAIMLTNRKQTPQTQNE